MADTLPSVTITDTWQRVTDLTQGEIATGEYHLIQVQTPSNIEMAISATEPAEGFRGVIVPSQLDRPVYNESGISDVWLRAIGTGNTAFISIQKG